MSDLIAKKSIAILLSTYNGEKYLDQQLESLSRQSCPFTLYVRDDGSTDNTIGIIKEWSDKIDIEILSNKEKLGPAKSFWELLKYPNEADVILFCDQDDVWDEDKVEKSIIRLGKHNCLSFCNCRIIDADGNLVQGKRLDETPDTSYERLFINGITQGCSMCMTRELKDFILSCTINCIPMHDIIVMLYAKAFGKIAWIDEPLFSYRIHGKNVVAKDKNPIRRVKKSLKNWKLSKDNSMSIVAAELMANCIDVKEKEFLTAVSKYKFSISDKMRVLCNRKLNQVDHDSKRSYLGRILINWF